MPLRKYATGQVLPEENEDLTRQAAAEVWDPEDEAELADENKDE